MKQSLSILMAMSLLLSLPRFIIAMDQDWSEPKLLISGIVGSIGELSPVFMAQDGSLHFACIWQQQTIMYGQIINGNPVESKFQITIDQSRSVELPQVVVDPNRIAYLFWIEQGFEEDSTFFRKGICLEVPLLTSWPYYGTWRADTLRSRARKNDTFELSPCISTDGSLHVCWVKDHLFYLNSKPSGQSTWIIPAAAMFPEFCNDNGEGAYPYLISGTIRDLYLTFIGSKDSDAMGGPAFKFLNFVYCAEKPLHTGRWSEPVLVFRDYTTAAIYPIMAVDRSGVRHIIWLNLVNPKQSPIISNVFYSYSSDGEHWSPARDLSGWSAWFAFPQIAIDSHGTLHVFWKQFRNTQERPGGIYYLCGREETWGDPILIFGDMQDKSCVVARVAIDAHDRLHLVRKIAHRSPLGVVYQHDLDYVWRDLNPTQIANWLNHHRTSDQALLSVRTHPNPFNETVTIMLLPQAQVSVSLAIYNIDGQRVRRFIDEMTLCSEYSCQWDGTNDSGALVSSGIYFVMANVLSLDRSQQCQIRHKILLVR